MLRKVLGLALAAPLSLVALDQAAAQDSAKPKRVGVLLLSSPQSDPVIRRVWETFVDGLGEHGWEVGRNVVLEGRFAGPDPARLSELAAELVALKVDAIVAGNSQSVDAARRETTTIPIVMLNVSDPVKSGFVASLARPAGNITGLASQMGVGTGSGKTLELLKGANLGIERVGIIYAPDNSASVASLKF